MPRSVMIDYNPPVSQYRQAAETGRKIRREYTNTAEIQLLSELAELPPLQDGDCIRMDLKIVTAKVKLKGFKLTPNVKHCFRVKVRCLDCGNIYPKSIRVVTFVKNGVSASLMAAQVGCAFNRLSEEMVRRVPYYRNRKTTVSANDCTCSKCRSFNVTPISITR